MAGLIKRMVKKGQYPVLFVSGKQDIYREFKII
jgi:hypothetical protein